MIRALIAVVMATAFVGAPALAQSAGENAEIVRLRAQIEDLTRRLEAVERSRAPPLETPARSSAPTSERAAVPAGTVAAAPASRSAAGLAATDPAHAVGVDLPANVPVGPADHTLAPPDRPTLFQLTASNSSSQASFALTSTVSRPNLGNEGRGTGTFTSITLGAQAPLDKDADTTSLATLDGLADSFALKIGFSQFRVALADPGPAMAALESAAVVACKADVRVSDKTDCDVDTNRQNILSTYLSPEDYRAYLSGGFPGDASLAFGLSGRVGYRKFSYLGTPATTKGTVERVPWSVGGYVTLFPGLSAASLTGGVEFQRSYKAAATQVICPVMQGAATLTCVTGAGGTPSRKDGLLLSLEGRRLFATGSLFLPTVGLAPQLTYDALQDRFGVDVPVYLVADGKSGLLGGVRVGWTSGDGGFVAGVFVGSAFSLFK